LLVEDDDAVRFTTRRVLESRGYTIREATTGREALELWRQHVEEIPLVLTDIIMPGGMTGLEMAEHMWGHRPQMKVIFMSGYSADILCTNTEFIRRTKRRFLQKPSSARLLLETIRRTLDEKTPPAIVRQS
jgi:DNA-binding NtrC family response regulator